jgi:hypothetical protein
MPKYVIERQYLLPVYQHLVIEAATLEEACSKAAEHDDWETAKEDGDGARPTTITNAVELPSDTPEPAIGDLPYFLYEQGLALLPIPDEFKTEEG